MHSSCNSVGNDCHVIVKEKVFQQNAAHVHVMVRFYPWFKFYFSLFLGMVMYENELKHRKNKI